MTKNIAPSAKRATLIALKEKLLQDIHYYDKRIKEFPTNQSKFYYDDSGSDEEILPMLINTDPSMSELQAEQKRLYTCLQATQELTDITVLQSEMNVMVQDPVLKGGKPVKEPGSWREVIAECQIDLVPFSLTFYTHKPSRKFAPNSFHELQVMPVKVAHQNELYKSVLSTVTKPSDAVEVVRSYAAAYRSRRTTLARLADRYANTLYMEPLAEGGFILKCADLMKMSWILDNKLSPLAPFKHKMNFELEYMDELYLKIIKQAHIQLCNPSLTTDERTQLLAKIISTCLEVQTPTQEVYESMESDQESLKKMDKTTLDTDDDVEEAPSKRTRDEFIMAPPKSLPKKAKPKEKGHKDENRKSVKRGSSHVESINVKKAKRDAVTDLVKNNDLQNENDGINDNDEAKHDIDEENDKENDTRNVKKISKVKKVVNENVVRNKHIEEGSNKLENSEKVSKNNEAKSSKTTKVTDNERKENSAPAKKVLQNTQAVKKVAGIPKLAKNVEGNEKIPNAKKTANIDPNAKKTSNIDNAKKTASVDPSAKKIAKVNNAKKSANIDPNAKETANIDPNAKKTANVDPNSKKTANVGNAKKTANVDPNAKKTANVDNAKNTANADSNAKKSTNVDNAKNTANADSNAKKSTNVDNAKNTANADSNAKKSTNVDPNAKKTANVDNAKNTANADSNAKKSTNVDPNAKKTANVDNAKNTANADSNAKKSTNVDPYAKKNAKTDSNAKKTTVDSNAKKTGNVGNANKTANIDPKKSSKTDPKNLTRNSSQTNDVQKNKIGNEVTERPIMVTSNTDNIPKVKDTTKKGNVASTDLKKINFASTDPKKINVASTDPKKINVARTDPKKGNVASIDPNKELPKNFQIQQNKPKVNVKSKMTIKSMSHRTSIGKPKKTITNMKTLKSNHSDEIGKKNPLKKLSPNYAAVLQQNPLRISPRIVSKFKSSSDSNIQMKLLKPVSKLPRLLKKPSAGGIKVIVN